MTKAVAFVIIAALAVVALLFVVLRSGGAPTSGGEVTTASGLKYIHEVVGTGDSPKTGQNVTVHR